MGSAEIEIVGIAVFGGLGGYVGFDDDCAVGESVSSGWNRTGMEVGVDVGADDGVEVSVTVLGSCDGAVEVS